MRSARKKKRRRKSEKVLLSRLRRKLDGAATDRDGRKRSQSRMGLSVHTASLPKLRRGGNGGEMTSEQKQAVLETLRRLSLTAYEIEVKSRRMHEALEVIYRKLEATQ